MTLRKWVAVAVLVGVLVAVFTRPDLRLKITSLFQSEGEKTGSPASLKEPLSVCVTRNGMYYHRSDCKKLEGRNKVFRPLSTARELYKPCSKCKPPK